MIKVYSVFSRQLPHYGCYYVKKSLVRNYPKYNVCKPYDLTKENQ